MSKISRLTSNGSTQTLTRFFLPGDLSLELHVVGLQRRDQVPHLLVDGPRLFVGGQVLLELDAQHLVFFPDLELR